MEQLSINATIRERQAKGDNRRLRRDGMVPAVIYGGADAPQNVAVSHHELELILRGARRSSAVFAVSVDGAPQQTIIRELQRHPVTGRLVHVDFQRVDMAQEIEVSVPIHAVGADPAGVKSGGILEHVTRTVAIRCTPLNMPKYLEADLTVLELNQSFHVSDLKLPEGVTVVDEPETALFTVLPPKATAEETGAPTVSEPEIVGGRKAEQAEG